MQRSTADAIVAAGGRPVLAIQGQAGHLRIGLVLPGIERIVDVSAHPAAALTAIHRAAAQSGTAAQEAEYLACGSVRNASQAHQAWTAPADAPLVTALGGAAFPMLGAAYDGGAGPVEELPRWSTDVLVRSTAREATEAAFGTSTTRTVIAALARSLQHSVAGRANLLSLAVALMGVGTLEPDQLARILDTRPCEPTGGPTHMATPTREVIALGQSATRRWGATRSTKVLGEALQSEGGLRLLESSLRHARSLADHGPARLPNRLADLHDAYRMRIPTDPEPRPQDQAPPDEAPWAPCPTVRRRNTALATPSVAPTAAQQRARAYRAPRGLPRVTATDRLHPSPLLLAMDGAEVSDLRLVVPLTVGDLMRWSRQLSNCLDTYGPGAATGVVQILGVEHGGELRYAVDLRQPGLLHQFLGRANRAPSRDHRLAVVDLLADRGLVDRKAGANQIWLADRQ